MRHVIPQAKTDWSAALNETRTAGLMTAVVPVHGRPKLTHECLLTLRNQPPGAPLEVLVVDNGSDLQTQSLLQKWAAVWPSLRVVRLQQNLGFARGCNVGFHSSRGTKVVFLNNDTRVTSGWLRPLSDALDDPRCLAVQPKLLYPDGSTQCAGVVFSHLQDLGYPLFHGLPGTHPAVNRPNDLQAVTAACVAVRAGDFAAVHGFDDVFINGQEDIDLCLRLKRWKQETSVNKEEEVGFFCRYEPQSCVYHHEGQTPGRWDFVRTNRQTFLNRWRGRIESDDVSHYAKFGFDVVRYVADNQANVKLGVAVYRPVLREIEPLR